MFDHSKAWTVDKDAWHYKLYQYWYNRMATRDNPYKPDYEYQGLNRVEIPARPENFCHYLRVVLLYVPLYFLPLVAIAVAITAVFGVGLWTLVPTFGLLGGLGVLVAGGLVSLGVVVGTAKLIEYFKNRSKEERQPGLFRTAMDSKVGTVFCPRIEFKGVTNHEQE